MNIKRDDNAIIIALAYPENFCAPSEERIAKISYLFGIGTKQAIKAGHAAMFLIHKERGSIEYFDFGRYMTPAQYGRVRSAKTDVELTLPFSIDIHDGVIENFQEILAWASSHPEKTHGEGALYTSVCSDINYERARSYIDNLQSRELVPYGIRGKEKSNCSRFVADTILAGSTSKRLTRRMKRCYIFTPSSLGIVKAADTEGFLYHACEGDVKHTHFQAWKENLKHFFDRNYTVNYTQPKCDVLEAQLLDGVGSKAFFHLKEHDVKQHVEVTRYNENGKEDFTGIFHCGNGSFDPQKKFTVIHPSHCKTCTVQQEGRKISFTVIDTSDN